MKVTVTKTCGEVVEEEVYEYSTEEFIAVLKSQDERVKLENSHAPTLSLTDISRHCYTNACKCDYAASQKNEDNPLGNPMLEELRLANLQATDAALKQFHKAVHGLPRVVLAEIERARLPGGLLSD